MMKTTRSIIAGAMLSFAMAGAAHADSGSHTPVQLFPNQSRKGTGCACEPSSNACFPSRLEQGIAIWRRVAHRQNQGSLREERYQPTPRQCGTGSG